MDPVTLAITGVMALIGGIFGLSSYDSQYKKGKEDAERELDRQKELKQEALDELDLDFSIAAKEAQKEADYRDKAANINEAAATNDINNSWKQLQLQQKGEANKWNNDLMNMSSQEGDALAAVAGSGTRTSSVQQAVDMQAAVNAQNLQIEQDLTRTGDNIGMGNIMAGVAKTVNQLQYNRMQANDIRQTYNEGGDKWQQYNMRRSNTEKGYNYNIEGIQNELDYAKKHAWEGYLTSFFTGGKSGYDLGSSIGKYKENWGNNSSFSNL